MPDPTSKFLQDLTKDEMMRDRVWYDLQIYPGRNGLRPVTLAIGLNYDDVLIMLVRK